MAQKIERSALVMHSAERMFDLVNDVAAYPQFLPWCAQTQVHQAGQAEVLASISIEKGAVRQRFTTRNSLSSPESIVMELVDGPFRFLKGAWTFSGLGDEASKVSLSLDFELSGVISKMAFGSVFAQATGSMVDAFCQRANEVYGNALHGYA